MTSRFAGERYQVAADLCFRAIGLAYFFAFASLFGQIPGLIGERGILPAGRFLRAVEHRFGALAWLELPTLAWLGTANWYLQGLCGLGLLAGLCIAVGRGRIGASFAAPVIAWVTWLSLVLVGGDFLQFQWEALLLETGFLAIFLVPSLGRRAPRPLLLFLFRFLLFRLVFSSGIAKLAGGDSTWWSMSALLFHFETQPLPTALGWVAHQLPELVLRALCFVTLVVEIVVPLFVLLPQPWPRRAFWPLVGLQVAIAATGNYAYFNWLSAALALFCLSDDWRWPAWARNLAGEREGISSDTPWIRRVSVAGALILATAGGVRLFQSAGVVGETPAFLGPVVRLTSRFHLVSSYGLFTMMTTVRDELKIEGSLDGSQWEPYTMAWKPEGPRRFPGWVAPHQPRLDWQAWFAALSDFEREYWLGQTMGRLLDGEPAVRALFGNDPFPTTPPRFVRVQIARYHFSSIKELWQTGNWWRIEPARDFGPIYTREVSSVGMPR